MYSFTATGDLANWQALAIEIPAGIVLAVVFYYFQWRAGNRLEQLTTAIGRLLKNQSMVVDQINKIVKIQADMIAEERTRQQKRRLHWLKQTLIHIQEIMRYYETMQGVFAEIKSQQDRDLHRLNLSLMAIKDMTFYIHLPRLETAIGQLADLIDDPALYDDLSAEQFYDDFLKRERDQSVDRTYQEGELDSLILRAKLRIPELKAFESRLQKEIEKIAK